MKVDCREITKAGYIADGTRKALSDASSKLGGVFTMRFNVLEAAYHHKDTTDEHFGFAYALMLGEVVAFSHKAIEAMDSGYYYGGSNKGLKTQVSKLIGLNAQVVGDGVYGFAGGFWDGWIESVSEHGLSAVLTPNISDRALITTINKITGDGTSEKFKPNELLEIYKPLRKELLKLKLI